MTNIDHTRDPKLDDPRLDDMRNAPLPVQEVYAWRLTVQDKKRGMTPEQRKAYYKGVRERTDAFCAERGFKLKYAEPAVTV